MISGVLSVRRGEETWRERGGGRGRGGLMEEVRTKTNIRIRRKQSRLPNRAKESRIHDLRSASSRLCNSLQQRQAGCVVVQKLCWRHVSFQSLLHFLCQGKKQARLTIITRLLHLYRHPPNPIHHNLHKIEPPQTLQYFSLPTLRVRRPNDGVE
jgi:hypothetical protein